MGYESYFKYKINNNDYTFTFEEYVVWNLYNGNFKLPFSVQKKSGFIGSYPSLLSKFSNSSATKLNKLSNHSNKVISTVAKNVSKLKLEKNDPILSGIIDPNHIKEHHSIIDVNVEEDDWNEFCEFSSDDDNLLFEDRKIKKWIDKIRNDKMTLKSSIKALIRDISYVWNNNNYQKRSPIINESTFTHDVLSPILKFVAPNYFKRWDQAQSLAAKDRGVLKYVDVIRNIDINGHYLENFFVEVSHRPFHHNPHDHVIHDNYKLAKLGKDSLDRNRMNFVDDDVIFLFHLHSDYLVVYFMDYYYHPIARKIQLDAIQIPFFANDTSFKLISFIKSLYKYRCMLKNLQKKRVSIINRKKLQTI
ncbi:hypothetical protein RclHR1_13590004 [Rhizophagus clarus]|uniref:Uncharacterized protein n=1 Tax=Rhizophagus clarus TaxID=94130 RepID=A0A2Z6QMT3_9GLOM|nr:hypothetical protein RclHR1_13590004 [Rhizophagus clarus]